MDMIKEEADVSQVRDELVKKNLILEQLDTFLVEYNFKTDELFIDPVKEKFIKIPWSRDNIIKQIAFLSRKLFNNRDKIRRVVLWQVAYIQKLRRE